MASTFAAALRSLLDSYLLAGLPAWNRVLVVEEMDGERLAGCTPPAQFESRFQDILRETSRDWINISALGVSGDNLLVCVEFLTRPPAARPGLTTADISVNLSGPCRGPAAGNGTYRQRFP